MEKNKINLNKNQQKKLVIILSIVLAVFGTYLAGLIYYSYHFLPNTTINGIDVSNMNKEQADKLLNEEKPVLTVIEKDKNGKELTETLELKNLNKDITYDSSYDLANQNTITWFIPQQSNLNCDKIAGEFSENKVASFISKLYCLQEENIVEPQNAQVVITDGKAEIKEENDGSFIEKDTVKEMITDGIRRFLSGSDDNSIRLIENYETASIYKDDPSFSEKKAKIEKLLDKKIELKISDENVMSIEGKELAELLTTENSEAIISEENVDKLIYDISKENNHNVDRSSLKNDLSAALLKDGDSTVEVKDKVKIDGLADVSLKEQTLYYYENDTLIMTSPVVTGNPDLGSVTPVGEYEIRRKKLKATLVSSEYVEHVDYWIGWDQTGRVYGFHDAQWRDAFGGDIYLSNPSHGCVNMPTDKVAMLYDMADIGTKVVIRE